MPIGVDPAHHAGFSHHGEPGVSFFSTAVPEQHLILT